MNRLKKIQEAVDSIYEGKRAEDRRNIYVHMYGVSSICSLLALKRGVNVELCAISGILHDISSYISGYSEDHAELGAIEAEKILNEADCFSKEEISIICDSISRHSDKQDIGNEYDEILKDADVLQHYLINTHLIVNANEKDRLKKLIEDFGMNKSI